MALRRYLRSLNPELPARVWVLQGGGLVNAFGNGIVIPFLIIYLHNVRGIPLALAGTIAATNSAAAFCSGFLAGALSDRIGPRAVLVGALALMAGAIALFPLIRESWHAFALMSVLGFGSGSFWPSQSTLLTRLAPAARRHSAFALQRVSLNLGSALGGLAGGLVASTAHPRSFTVLFVVDAATFAAYALVVARLPTPPRDPERAAGSYLEVVRDRPFIAYTLLNALFMAAGMALVVEMLPPFAKNDADVSERGVGVIWFVNALVIVAAQLPVARLMEGRRRMRGIALMGAIWATTMLAIGAAGYWLSGATAAAAMAGAVAVFALGQCVHGTIQAPLSADLAPPQLVGRYLAFSSQSWQIGWIVGPAVGGVFLQHAPYALWPVAAAANAVGALAALVLERALPREVRLTPRTVPSGRAAVASPATPG